MTLYEPAEVAAWLTETLTDEALLLCVPGGVHETDAHPTASAHPGTEEITKTVKRRATPYLVFSLLSGAGDIQGAGGTILVADMDYAVQVLYRPGEQDKARRGLRRVQELLEGVEPDIAEGQEAPAHAITVRGMGLLPRLADREPGNRLIYSEGRRWRFRVQRI
jgi:hypothetical protein